jgi:hypothetical protein
MTVGEEPHFRAANIRPLEEQMLEADDRPGQVFRDLHVA